MKPIIMFITSWCPYCTKALAFMKELEYEDPKYKNLEIKVIDEELDPITSKKYDYYYVPTYYIENVKAHEGAASKELIKSIFDKAME